MRGYHAQLLRSFFFPRAQRLPLGPRASLRGRPSRCRTASSLSAFKAGENKSGHIALAENEGLLFLDSTCAPLHPWSLLTNQPDLFPLKLRVLLRIPFFNAEKSIADAFKHIEDSKFKSVDPAYVIKRAIPDTLPITVKEIIPLIKEGGAFVKFDHPAKADMRSIESDLQTFLRQNRIEPMYNPWGRVRAAMVRGKPWIEDLYRFPSPRIKIDFLSSSSNEPAAELSQEQMYTIFRKFGKIVDIASPPPDSKVLPRFATVTFKLTRQSVMAKNCIHGYVVPEAEGGGRGGTLIRISYERIIKAHWIRDWFTSHPRVVLPLLLAVATAITVAIFDPIRTWFIKAHVTHSFGITDNKTYRWLRSQINRANNILSFKSRRAEDDSLKEIWDDRMEDIQQIKTWLLETTDTFVVVQGPRGSGKKELVMDQALKGRSNTLLIDCKTIQEASSDSAKILAAAKEVNYRPVFSWMNSMSSLIDLAAQGTVGIKAGFTETLDSQLQAILSSTATALRQVALEEKQKDETDKSMSDDEYLEAHPESRPVVVIDNFLHRASENTLVHDKIANWAASMATAHVAHVIFLTHDLSFAKSLSKALPDRVFRQVTLGDCSPEVAKRFVMRHLDPAVSSTVSGEKRAAPLQSSDDERQLDAGIEVIGGRLTDLELLASRMKTGEKPGQAVEEIVDSAASEILKMYILDKGRASRTWTSQQAWYLIKALAAHEALRYHEVLLADTWKSDGDDVLAALEQAELISIATENGRPSAIRPGRPVFRAAFRHLTRDRVLAARLDLDTLVELVKIESAGIEKAEGELQLLGGLPKQPSEMAPRVRYLLQKLQGSQVKIEKYERESAELKKILQKEY